MKKGISVIICCYNSEKRLPQTLKHLIEQQVLGFEWEIIVVDNASADNTNFAAREILLKIFSEEKIKVISEPKPGLSNARKRGYATAQFEYLLFCDDDNWLNKNYLQEAFRIIESNPEIGILGGKGEAIFEETKPDWFDTYQINFAVGEQGSGNTEVEFLETVYGAGFIVRKKIFQTLDAIGFNSLLTGRKGKEIISGEDTELCLAIKYLGYKIAYSPLLQFKHLMPAGRMNWEYLKKLHYGFGKSRLYIQAYKYIETHHEIPGKNLKLPLWLDKFIHNLRELKKFIPSVYFKYNEQGNADVLKYFALRGEINELLQLKNNYAKVFETIAETQKKIKELQKQ